LKALSSLHQAQQAVSSAIWPFSSPSPFWQMSPEEKWYASSADRWDNDPRLTPDLRCAYTVGTIIGLNTLVWLAWRFRRLRPVLEKHFVMRSPLRARRLHTTVLSAFSHQSLIHLGMNMACMTSLAQDAFDTLGPSRFVGCYLGWAAVASLATALVPASLPALGASGAVCALLAFHVLSLSGQGKLHLMFMPSVEFDAHQGLLGLVLFDVCGLLFFRRRSPIAHAAHLGGVGAGAATFALLQHTDQLRNYHGEGVRHSKFGLQARAGHFRDGLLDGPNSQLSRPVLGPDLRPVRTVCYTGSMQRGMPMGDGLLATCDAAGTCEVFVGQFHEGKRVRGYNFQTKVEPLQLRNGVAPKQIYFSNQQLAYNTYRPARHDVVD